MLTETQPTAPDTADATASDSTLSGAWRLSSKTARARIRAGFNSHTSGMAPGYGQGNLMILPKSWADEFLAFCRANSTPCPLIGMTENGSSLVPMLGDDVDLKTDLPRYRVWVDGVMTEERDDISDIWTEDLVGFVLGCSLSFEGALEAAGLRVRHVDEDMIVPMYRTNIQTQTVGRLHGPTVVSMRPYTPEQARLAYEICARLPGAHGAPIHMGDPATIGIQDVMLPDEGEPTDILPGEVPVFWACGVTPQSVAMQAKPPFCITHAPGHMLISDVKTEDLVLL